MKIKLWRWPEVDPRDKCQGCHYEHTDTYCRNYECGYGILKLQKPNEPEPEFVEVEVEECGDL